MNTIAGFYSEWPYGLVAAVALALDSGGNIIETALDRLLATTLSVVIGTAISTII